MHHAGNVTRLDSSDLTVRVGCSLAYEVQGNASLLLNLQPRPNRNHAVIWATRSIFPSASITARPSTETPHSVG